MSTAVWIGIASVVLFGAFAAWLMYEQAERRHVRTKRVTYEFRIDSSEFRRGIANAQAAVQQISESFQQMGAAAAKAELAVKRFGEHYRRNLPRPSDSAP